MNDNMFTAKFTVKIFSIFILVDLDNFKLVAQV